MTESKEVPVYRSEQQYLYHLEYHGFRIVRTEGDKYWLKKVAPTDEEGGKDEKYNKYDKNGIYCGDVI